VSRELGTNWASAHGLALADYDGDGVDEVFLGTASLYSPYFLAYDVASDTVAWTSAYGSSSGVVAVAAADMDADGFPDLVGLTSDGYVWIHDVRDQTLLWKSISLGWAAAMEVSDIDRDGTPEIVVSAGSRLVAYRWSAQAATFVEVASAPLAGVTDLAVGDCDADGAPEIYALGGATYSGSSSVTRLDGALVPLGSFTADGTAQSLFVEDVGAGRKNLALGLADPYAYGTAPGLLVAVDPVTGAEEWRSPPLWGTVTADGAHWLDLGGSRRIAFATSTSMYLTR
jgi:VCBS repeat protein